MLLDVQLVCLILLLSSSKCLSWLCHCVETLLFLLLLFLLLETNFDWSALSFAHDQLMMARVGCHDVGVISPRSFLTRNRTTMKPTNSLSFFLSPWPHNSSQMQNSHERNILSASLLFCGLVIMMIFSL